MSDILDQPLLGIPLKTWLILVAVGLVLAGFAGSGPLAGYLSGDEEATQTFVSSSYTNSNPVITTSSISPNTAISPGSLALDSEFVSLVIDGKTLATSSINYNDATKTATVQIDAESSNDGSNTVFTILGMDSSGVTQELANETQVGVLADPLSNNPVQVPFTISITESLLGSGGFTNTQEVMGSSISAKASKLTSDSGKDFYPIAIGDVLNLPEVKVDGRTNLCSYSWTATTAQKTVSITGTLDWDGIYDMESISDDVPVTITCQDADDSPLTVRFVRNTGLTA